MKYQIARTGLGWSHPGQQYLFRLIEAQWSFLARNGFVNSNPSMNPNRIIELECDSIEEVLEFDLDPELRDRIIKHFV